MPGTRFATTFDDLPLILPIFPLPGAIVLPGQLLPLNIFEPRYLNMFLDCLGHGRIIGMIQPLGDVGSEPVPVHPIGCAGRVSAFQETPDGRLLVNLTGVCRFAVTSELELYRGYRRVEASWDEFRSDFEPTSEVELSLGDLEPALRAYFAAQNSEPRWDTLQKFSAAGLIDFLAMTLPFGPLTKQSLVEARDTNVRGKLLMSALADALMDGAAPPERRH